MSQDVISQPAPDFAEITRLIDSARLRAYQAVNTTLIELYWQVGAYLSRKIASAEWGEGIVEQLAQSGELGRQRRLADVQAPRGAGHVAFGEQRIEGHEQVEVDLAQVHGQLSAKVMGQIPIIDF